MKCRYFAIMILAIILCFVICLVILDEQEKENILSGSPQYEGVVTFVDFKPGGMGSSDVLVLKIDNSTIILDVDGYDKPLVFEVGEYYKIWVRYGDELLKYEGV